MKTTILTFTLVLIATILFLFVASTSAVESTAAATPAPSPDLSTFGCDTKCNNRCSNAGYKERCLKYCGICCGKCWGCVPSSPYADKAECPCYRELKNSKGKDKCP